MNDKNKIVRKQIVQKSATGNGIVVREQDYDATTGIGVGEPKVGTIQFDTEISNATAVLEYARKREWKLVGEPNRIGQFQTENVGALAEPMRASGKGRFERTLGWMYEGEDISELKPMEEKTEAPVPKDGEMVH